MLSSTSSQTFTPKTRSDSKSHLVSRSLHMAHPARSSTHPTNSTSHSPCFDTISSTAVTLANGCISEAIGIAKGPRVLAYENIQVSTSPLIEQREGAPAKVQSGTVSVIYSALSADPNDMSLSQIHKNWCETGGLSYANDIRQTREQLRSHFEQLVIHAIRVLRHLKGAEDISNNEDFQHLERRKLPASRAMKQYPLRASHLEEASVQGTSQWSTMFISLSFGCRKRISTTARSHASAISSLMHGFAQPNSPIPPTTTYSLSSSFYNSVLVFFMHI